MSEPETPRVEQRERILEAARRLFSDHGASDVTMAEIASDAGVARATVSRYFGSKHALIEAITEDVLVAYGRMLEGAFADRHTPTPELIRGLFDAMAQGIEADRRFHRALFREMSRLILGFDLGGSGHDARQRNHATLAALLSRGQDRAELDPRHDVEDLAVAIDFLTFGAITHWLYRDSSGSLRTRMSRAADLFLEPVVNSTALRARRADRSATNKPRTTSEA